MADPTYPIFIFDDFDLFVLPSLDRLQSSVELVDVRWGIFETFDTNGRHVHLGTTRWDITAEIDPSEPIANRELETKLRASLRAMGDLSADDSECLLPCLMEAAKKSRMR